MPPMSNRVKQGRDQEDAVINRKISIQMESRLTEFQLQVGRCVFDRVLLLKVPNIQ